MKVIYLVDIILKIAQGTRYQYWLINLINKSGDGCGNIQSRFIYKPPLSLLPIKIHSTTYGGNTRFSSQISFSCYCVRSEKTVSIHTSKLGITIPDHTTVNQMLIFLPRNIFLSTTVTKTSNEFFIVFNFKKILYSFPFYDEGWGEIKKYWNREKGRWKEGNVLSWI